MTTPCPSEDRLRDWVAGRLGEAEGDEVGRHADGCAGCQSVLEEILPGSVSGAAGASLSVFVRRLAGSLPAEVLRAEPRVRGGIGEAATSIRAPGEAALDTFRPESTVSGAKAGSKGSGPLPELADYEVLRVLGRGGMGVVYLARHRRLKRLTAVKMLSERLAEEPRQWTRMLREAEVLARLRHPNVVQVYDAAEQEGRPFLAMEYVEGGTLSDRHRDRPAEPGEAARLVERIARGVHAAHLVGVVHRDLKPANVLLDGDEPKVTDFGLAKEADSGDSLTPTGAVVGTPQYMAPEQVVPGPGAASASVDVYALGAILYDLLTGRPPHVGSNIYETLDLVRRRNPVPPSRLAPGVPAELERICLRCLEKNPARRFESASAVAEALGAFREGWVKAAAPRVVGDRRRVLWRWAGIGAAAVCGVVLLAFAVLHFKDNGVDSLRDGTARAGGAASQIGTSEDGNAAATRDVSPRKGDGAAFDPVPAGSSWAGTFTFLPAPEDRIDGGARLEIETRTGDEFTGIYESEEGRYAWRVRGAVQGEQVRWEFTEAVRDNPEASVVGRVSMDGTVKGDLMELRWREPLRGEEARVVLRRE